MSELRRSALYEEEDRWRRDDEFRSAQLYDDDDDVNEGDVELRRYFITEAAVRRRLGSVQSRMEEVSQASSYDLCLVCLEHVDVVNIGRRGCCDLPVCDACLETYVRSKLSDGIVRIGCPNPACDHVLQVVELTRLEQEVVQMFYRRLIDANSDPHRKTCPNCCTITEMDQQSAALNDDKASNCGLSIDCTECNFRWCFRCHGPWHHGVSCDDSRASDNLLQKWAKCADESNVLNAQECPVCKIYIERTSGCPHMECRMCGSQFCYYCAAFWHDDHLMVCPHKILKELVGRSRRHRRMRRLRRLRKKLKTGGIIGGALIGGVIVLPIVIALAVPVVAGVAGYLAVNQVKRAVNS